jgi:hypothetical protein
MKRLIVAAGGLILAAALTGCGSTTDSLDFKVPNGYQAKFNTMVMSLWTKGSSTDSVIMLMKIPVKTSESDFQVPDSAVKDAKIQSKELMTICGDHQATLMKMTGTSSQSKKNSNVEMLLTSWGSTTYMAMYVYPKGEGADPNAEAAIKSVCQKKT